MAKIVTFDAVRYSYPADALPQSLGSEIQAKHPDAGGKVSTAVLCKAKTAVTQGRTCVVNPDTFEVEQITKARVDALGAGWEGVAGADAAVDEYLWVVTEGKWPVYVKANCAAHSALYTSGTTGALDDTAASQTRVYGVFLVKAKGTGDGPAMAVLNWPQARN